MTEEERKELRRTVDLFLSGWWIRKGPTSCSRAEADLERGIIRRLLYSNLDIGGELMAIMILGTK